MNSLMRDGVCVCYCNNGSQTDFGTYISNWIDNIDDVCAFAVLLVQPNGTMSKMSSEIITATKPMLKHESRIGQKKNRHRQTLCNMSQFCTNILSMMRFDAYTHISNHNAINDDYYSYTKL